MKKVNATHEQTESKFFINALKDAMYSDTWGNVEVNGYKVLKEYYQGGLFKGYTITPANDVTENLFSSNDQTETLNHVISLIQKDFDSNLLQQV